MTFERLGSGARRALLAAGAALAVLAAGCGGGGAGAGGGTIGGKSAVGTVEAIADKSVLPAADGSTSATVTVQVKDAGNNVMRTQAVSLTSTDPGIAISALQTPAVTDAAGRVTFRVEARTGASSRANRTIPLVATSGSVSAPLEIRWTNTKITIAGPTSVTVGVPTDYTVKVVDGAGNAVPGNAVQVSYPGGTVTPATTGGFVTDSLGEVRVSLNAGASDAAPRPLTALAVGLNATQDWPVLARAVNQPFRFLQPVDNLRATVGAAQTIVVEARDGAAPVPAGTPITVATSRGTLGGGGSTSVTLPADVNGRVTTTVQSLQVGGGSITASIGTVGALTGQTITQRINFISTTPARIDLSPSLNSIGTNAIGSDSNKITLRATVRDAADNPVSGAMVSFSATDPSGGRIEPAVVTTGDNGQAVSSFIAGPNSTGQDAVFLTASVTGTSVVPSTRRVTVSSEALFVELGTGNQISAVDTTTYAMPWAAIVTDGNRNPVVGAPVSVSLVAVNYYKGIWFYDGSGWTPRLYDDVNQPPRECRSEDLPAGSTGRPNGLLDAGEDRNANGRLDPGSPAAVIVSSSGGVTGADGRITLDVIYPKSFGLWVEVTMRVTIGSSGSETDVYRTFVLPVLGPDVSNADTAPPNVGARLSPSLTLPPGTPAQSLIGPYGYDSSRVFDATQNAWFCTSPN